METPIANLSGIRVSPDGRSFLDRTGAPFFWLGDTQWELFRLFDSETALSLLRKRQAQGFSIILIMLTGIDFRLLDPSTTTPYTNLAGEAPWLDGDPEKPNERYFQHVDQMIHLGERTGQILVVGVYHQVHATLITLEKARGWARWVASRYRDVPNVIWSMYPQATPAYVPVCRELAAGLQEGDGGSHLISVHPDPAVASSSFLHDEPWLAFNMIQTCIDYERIVETVTADYQRQPAKPVIMAEGGYEGTEFGRVQTALEIRKQAYWSQLAGGYHVYGHNDAWQAPQQWRTWIDAPGAQSLQVFREVITACAGWWTMVPDQGLFIQDTGQASALHVAARAGDGSRTLVYLSEPTTCGLRVAALEPAPSRATWIDPATGQRCPTDMPTTAGVMRITTPAGWDDALLLLEAG